MDLTVFGFLARLRRTRVPGRDSVPFLQGLEGRAPGVPTAKDSCCGSSERGLTRCVSPGSGARAGPELHLQSGLQCFRARLCLCRAVPVTVVRLEEVLGLRHLPTEGFTFCCLWWSPQCSPRACCGLRCLRPWAFGAACRKPDGLDEDPWQRSVCPCFVWL